MKQAVKFGRNNLGNVLSDNNLNGIGIEIGVAVGNFSRIIANNFGLEKLYLLDNWKGYKYVSQKKQDQKYNVVLKLAKDSEGLIEIVKSDSVGGSQMFEDGYFDFIYIDADHNYDAVVKDLDLWYPKLKQGGLFAGHDYWDFGVVDYGVREAVDEFCAEMEKDFFVTAGTRRIPPSWYLIK